MKSAVNASEEASRPQSRESCRERPSALGAAPEAALERTVLTLPETQRAVQFRMCACEPELCCATLLRGQAPSLLSPGVSRREGPETGCERPAAWVPADLGAGRTEGQFPFEKAATGSQRADMQTTGDGTAGAQAGQQPRNLREGTPAVGVCETLKPRRC